MLLLVVLMILSLEDDARGQNAPDIEAICEKMATDVSIVGAFRLPGDPWTHLLTSPTTGYSLKDLKYHPERTSDTKLTFNDVKEYDLNILYLKELPADAHPVMVTLRDSEPGNEFTYFWSPQSNLSPTHVDKDGNETAVLGRESLRDPGDFSRLLVAFLEQFGNSSSNDRNYLLRILAMASVPRVQFSTPVQHLQRVFLFYKNDVFTSELHNLIAWPDVVSQGLPKKWRWERDRKYAIDPEKVVVEGAIVLDAVAEMKDFEIQHQVKLLVFFDRPAVAHGRYRIYDVLILSDRLSGEYLLFQRNLIKEGAVRDLFGCKEEETTPGSTPGPTAPPDTPPTLSPTLPAPTEEEIETEKESIPTFAGSEETDLSTLPPLPPPTAPPKPEKKKSKISLALVLAALALVALLLCCLACLVWILLRKKKPQKKPVVYQEEEAVVTSSSDSLKTIRSDTSPPLEEITEEDLEEPGSDEEPSGAKGGAEDEGPDETGIPLKEVVENEEAKESPGEAGIPLSKADDEEFDVERSQID